MIARASLNINLPVDTKRTLMELARKEGVTMTDLIIRWVEESEVANKTK